jgi:hypothetical protein
VVCAGLSKARYESDQGNADGSQARIKNAKIDPRNYALLFCAREILGSCDRKHFLCGYRRNVCVAARRSGGRCAEISISPSRKKNQLLRHTAVPKSGRESPTSGENLRSRRDDVATLSPDHKQFITFQMALARRLQRGVPKESLIQTIISPHLIRASSRK